MYLHALNYVLTRRLRGHDTTERIREQTPNDCCIHVIHSSDCIESCPNRNVQGCTGVQKHMDVPVRRSGERPSGDFVELVART